MNHSISMSRHAMARCQQRGIQPTAVGWVLDYGQRHRAREGAFRVFLDKRSKKRLMRDLGPPIFDRLKELLDICVVVGVDEKVISVMKLTKRIKRDLQ